MPAPSGLSLTYGIKPINKAAVDAWSGPYGGDTTTLPQALADANGSIPSAIRFKSMQVRLIVGGKSYLYWYRDGTGDLDLVPFTAPVQEGTLAPAAGSAGEVQYRGADGNLTASNALVFNYSRAALTSSFVVATSGFSGSLTRLADGSSYLIGGNGITISSGSSGAVTISASQITPEYFLSTQQGYLHTTGSVSFSGKDDEVNGDTVAKGSNVFFYVSGSRDGSADSLFGGNVVTSGSLAPGLDVEYDLGSEERRWRNIYTGDLHLKNDRGNWTVIEEEEYLTIRNNKTGKLFRIVMEPI